MLLLALDTENLRQIAASTQSREHRAFAIAETIRDLGGFRWVGIFDVEESEIAALAWTDIERPAHERFPIDEGLNGEAVRTGEIVNIGDVSTDTRYVSAYGSTQSEIIIPIRALDGEHIVGTIDVESDRLYAFGPEEIQLLEGCAEAIASLWRLWSALP
jgi:L-methionine (R)-S-oxide reductase